MKTFYYKTARAHSRLSNNKFNYWCNDAQHTINKIQNPSFEEVYQCLKKLAKEHKGVGELLIYDTMLWLGYKPTKLYLHRGTLVGYKNYCEYKEWPFNSTKKQLEYSDLHSNCNGVSFENLEDYFCVCKDDMKLLDETILKNKSVKQKCKIGC